MPVSWKDCACHLDSSLNPDSLLGVAEMMDFGRFCISRFNSQVPDQGKTLGGYQHNTAEVPGRFATKAEYFLIGK